MVGKDRPAFLPFLTKADLLLFDDASEDDYKAFIKVSNTACEEAMSRHENVFSKPDNMGFSHVMTKAFDEKDMLMIKA
ncbi:hypothetical protein TSAR_004526 [Trichomalopsis sarcophagae]|uniref:Uncharacterized protein n=1 Tax=Trichomalopsis sarcophagae TaxID=543379 RepID=A0A232ED47_9HYME|nr:hypothetical protein TSAR_004526 [Trichomalopsis sarcophagae]